MARRILLEDQLLLDLQPAIAADRLDRAPASPRSGWPLRAWLHSFIAAPPASPASSRSMSSVGDGLGRRDQQQIGEFVALRIEAADRHAGENARLRPAPRRPAPPGFGSRSANSLKKLWLTSCTPGTFASRSASATAVGVVEPRQPGQPGFAEQRQMDREGERAQPGIGADVARRLLAADVLLARRQGQHPAAPAVGIDGLADQPARHLAHEFLAAWRTARHTGRRN